ncbi:MAG: non-ribosomal peptide synthetase, partial [Herpetosiphonaceae bacterium]|nr:non-ribosomal peptide synthetase [Herpetosiphonaceae bacterium]
MSEHSDANQPSQTDLTARRNTLSAAKKAWLEKRIRGETASLSQVKTIARLDSYTNVPLSYAQERLWFLCQLDPATSNAYTVPFAVQLDGPLDATILQQALQQVVDRHASLRTTFHVHAGVPVQHVAPTLALDLPVRDLPAATDAAGIAAQLAALVSAPFDLADGPLIRASLLRLSPTTHVLLVTCHHIITDGWSVGVFLRDFAAALIALRTGSAPDLPPLTVQYPDVAVWQRQVLQGAYLATLQTYWRTQLADTAPLALPTDFPRPAVQAFAGATLPLPVP